MQEKVTLLNVLYQNAEMGIIGIEDVIYKTKHPKLHKELEKEKKEYQKLLRITKQKIKKEHGNQKNINMFAKISSSLFSDMKLMNNDSDKIIIKMMIEGSYKSIGILTTKALEYKNVDSNTQKMVDVFIKTLENNIANLKKIDQFV